MTICYVGLGSNLAQPEKQVRRAFDELAQLPGTKLVARSSLYRTAPVGFASQPDFVNAVAALETSLSAETLLAELQRVEAAHGRSRSFPNAPRTLDLDLLLYGEERIGTSALAIPHPRMLERAFVLAPLVEIAPEVVIPAAGHAREWLARCRGQRVERLA